MILSRQQTADSRQQTADSRQAIIERAVAHIEKNIGNSTLSNGSIARAAGTNVAALIVVFEAVLGKSVWEFVMDRRFEHAKAMIENDKSKPLNEVALEVGMVPKYFTDFFYARMSVPATE